MDISRRGYVYVLTNPAMPGYVKIGRSIYGGKKRASELYQTGVPVPFSLHFEMLFDDAVEGELLVHERLQSNRVSEDREFFLISPELAGDAVVEVWANNRSLTLIDDVSANSVQCIEHLAHLSDAGFLDVLMALHLISPAAVHSAIHMEAKARESRLIQRGL